MHLNIIQFSYLKTKQCIIFELPQQRVRLNGKMIEENKGDSLLVQKKVLSPKLGIAPYLFEVHKKLRIL